MRTKNFFRTNRSTKNNVNCLNTICNDCYLQQSWRLNFCNLAKFVITNFLSSTVLLDKKQVEILIKKNIKESTGLNPMTENESLNMSLYQLGVYEILIGLRNIANSSFKYFSLNEIKNEYNWYEDVDLFYYEKSIKNKINLIRCDLIERLNLLEESNIEFCSNDYIFCLGKCLKEIINIINEVEDCFYIPF